MPNILAEIISHRKKALPDLQKVYAFLGCFENLPCQKPRISLSKVLIQQKQIGIISELKPASPSKGYILQCKEKKNQKESDSYETVLNPTLHNIENIIKLMLANGVIGISILTEPRFFAGSYGNLMEAAKIIPPNIPILMKDFVVDEMQIRLGKLCGASNGLVIAKIEDPILLCRKMQANGLEPLVEIHDEADLEKIKALKNESYPFIIGINNRNLDTLSIDLQTTTLLVPKVRAHFGEQQPIITESGIETKKDLLLLSSSRIQGALIGTAILSGDIEANLRALRIPMTPFCKVCGIKNIEMFNALSAGDVSAFGVIVDVPTSPRNLSIPQVQQLFQVAPKHLIKVVVTREKSMDYITMLNAILSPDLIQYHGKNISELLPKFPPSLLPKLILPIHSEEELATFRKLLSNSPQPFGFIVDLSEGSGQQFDAALVSHIIQRNPSIRIIIAGGLGPNNIAQVIHDLRPFGIDASSALETEGKKDPALISAFLQEIHLIRDKLPGEPSND